ncbi:SNF2 family N-terminal domain-containing protein [Stachybotrys elegans]|uniref:SNF2 family N-terminal domain-containing protein n=1 Tax=Stachybotrys elegans TaxID=80388 RepID=A0A8K0WM16_9HYPO|nr:SNF2 family N-terminal domain-containing protein [Stachybotrys elegans]
MYYQTHGACQLLTATKIMTKAVSSFNNSQQPALGVPVDMTVCGNTLKLFSQDSNKYAGIIQVPELAMLMRDFSVRLSAKLLPPHGDSKRLQPFKGDKVFGSIIPQDCPVMIVICGLLEESDAVGNLLSEAGLYLQPPSINEFDRGLKYMNPHWLLRPGSEMPSLAQAESLTSPQATVASEILDEATKCHFMRLFDATNYGQEQSLVEPSPRLSAVLEDHQLSALGRMAETERGVLMGGRFPSLWEASQSPGETEDMGLGKTLSFLALLCWSLDALENEPELLDAKDGFTTLIVTPKSSNCTPEYCLHTKHGHVAWVIYHGPGRQSMFSKSEQNIHVVLTTYETMRSDWANQGPLYQRRWYRVVLDEAHHIRSLSSQKFKAACAIQAKHRWCLTGTPIHNSLIDYYALLAFVGVIPFADKSAFEFWIGTPLKRNEPNSLRKLEILIRATCLRRTKEALSGRLKLPKRTDRVKQVDLDAEDRQLYTFFKRRAAEMASGIRQLGSTREESTSSRVLTLINFLRRICDHGEHLLPVSAVEAWRADSSASVDWQMMREGGEPCAECGACNYDAAAADPELGCGHFICPTCIAEEDDNAANQRTCSRCAAATTVAEAGRNPPLLGPRRSSAKMRALLDNLRKEQRSDEQIPGPTNKSVVFSSWTGMLDLALKALQSSGYVCERIDGRASLQERSNALRRFNQDPKCTVMLASIGSVGEGVDLTAASHVHLLEPSWNPMTERQAVDRVHRIGQTREVLTTRYITRDSIETYVQWIQQDKLRLINQTMNWNETSSSSMDEQRLKVSAIFLHHLINAWC